MGSFIADGAAALPDVKSDARAPTGAPTEWAAGDANELRQASLDLRASLLAEIASRVAAEAAIIASGATPANVSTAPVIATGTTTARTVADRYADYVNVKDFGASAGASGATNAGAIQAAIAYGLSSGKKGVDFGTENYTIDTEIAFNPSGAAAYTGFHLFGEGARLTATHAGAAISINTDNATADEGRVWIDGISLTGPGIGVAGSIGIYGGPDISAQVRVSNSIITGFETGTKGIGALLWWFDGVRWSSNGMGVDFAPSGVANANALTFNDCVFDGNTRAVKIDGFPASTVAFNNCQIERNNPSGSVGDGVTVLEFLRAGKLTFNACHFELNTGTRIVYYRGVDESTMLSDDPRKTIVFVNCHVANYSTQGVFVQAGYLIGVGGDLNNNSNTDGVVLGSANAWAFFQGCDVQVNGVTSTQYRKQALFAGRGFYKIGALDNSAPALANTVFETNQDTAIYRALDEAGSYMGSVEFYKATFPHALVDNVGLGWQVYGTGGRVCYIGRSGAITIEPGVNHGGSLGSGSAYWGNVYADKVTLLSGATITTGTGAPSADATIGSLYLRSDGGVSTSLYVKTAAGAGAGNWTAK